MTYKADFYYWLQNFSERGFSLHQISALTSTRIQLVKSAFIRCMASGEYPDMKWPMLHGIRVPLNVKPTIKRKRIDPSTDKAILRLNKLNMSYSAIGRKLGVSTPYVSKVCRAAVGKSIARGGGPWMTVVEERVFLRKLLKKPKPAPALREVGFWELGAILALRRKGYDMDGIAAKMRGTVSSVRKVLSERGRDQQ